MTQLIDRHLLSFLVDVLRLCLWLVILAAIFVPLERLFALHPQRVFRTAMAIDLGYYFLNSLLTGVLLSVPVAVIALVMRHIVPDAVHAAVAAFVGSTF